MSNLLAEAAKILNGSWCTNEYRNNRGTGVQFCAMGALMQAIAKRKGIDFNEAKPLVWHLPELDVLRETIIENYPGFDLDHYVESGTIIQFNDDVAQSADEVIAMFDKAAVRWEENESVK